MVPGRRHVRTSDERTLVTVTVFSSQRKKKGLPWHARYAHQLDLTSCWTLVKHCKYYVH
jgi:hypothetical protein